MLKVHEEDDKILLKEGDQIVGRIANLAQANRIVKALALSEQYGLETMTEDLIIEAGGDIDDDELEVADRMYLHCRKMYDMVVTEGYYVLPLGNRLLLKKLFNKYQQLRNTTTLKARLRAIRAMRLPGNKMPALKACPSCKTSKNVYQQKDEKGYPVNNICMCHKCNKIF